MGSFHWFPTRLTTISTLRVRSVARSPWMRTSSGRARSSSSNPNAPIPHGLNTTGTASNTLKLCASPNRARTARSNRPPEVTQRPIAASDRRPLSSIASAHAANASPSPSRIARAEERIASSGVLKFTSTRLVVGAVAGVVAGCDVNNSRIINQVDMLAPTSDWLARARAIAFSRQSIRSQGRFTAVKRARLALHCERTDQAHEIHDIDPTLGVPTDDSVVRLCGGLPRGPAARGRAAAGAGGATGRAAGGGAAAVAGAGRADPARRLCRGRGDPPPAAVHDRAGPDVHDPRHAPGLGDGRRIPERGDRTRARNDGSL